MNETSLIHRIRSRAARHGDAARGLVLGIGDDCAIFRPRTGEDLVFTTDLLIEDVHFRRDYPPRGIGHRALARGLSDIAAMGAAPRFCLLSLAVTRATPQRWIDRFFDGLLALAARTGTTLSGGDLSHSETITADIVVCGSVARGAALRRDTARPGDSIYVSGVLGGAALGLERRRGEAWKRHLTPEPRIDFGRRLIGRATACMDLSDGLSLDLHRLCLASRVAAELEEVPVFPGATEEQALHGGEDYELLFTAVQRPPRGALRVGTIVRGEPGAVLYRGRPLPAAGYDHFRQRDPRLP